MIAGEVHNSNSSTKAAMESVWDKPTLLKCRLFAY